MEAKVSIDVLLNEYETKHSVKKGALYLPKSEDIQGIGIRDWDCFRWLVGRLKVTGTRVGVEVRNLPGNGIPRTANYFWYRGQQVYAFRPHKVPALR